MSNDHSTRQVLPLSAAVKPVRFSTTKHWAISQTVREVLDSFDTPLRPLIAPPVERDIDHAESIIMSGNEIVNTLRTGSHQVKQRRTADLAMLPMELAVVEPFAPDAILQTDAATALAKLNDHKPHARRGARLPRPATKAPRAASTRATILAVVLGVVMIAALIYVTFVR